MAAISNDNWKQGAMDRAQLITDYWDITKAYAGRAAEVVLSICMFASIIGVLPGVHYWPFANNLILSVQIIMLDMGGFALASLAEHARDAGQEEAADQAENMGKFLIRLVIATLALITIGQLASIAGPYAGLIKTVVSYAETLLILVRVVSTVQYIHVIHSLRGSTTLDIQSIQVPTQPAQNDQIEALQKAVEDLSSQLGEMQPTQIVEAPTHDLYTSIQPLKIRSAAAFNGLQLLAQVASSTSVDELPIEDEITVEADTAVPEQISYPVVPGVSAEKVKSSIDAHLSGAKWRDLPGNYSQTVKPIRDLWEATHPSIQNV